MDLITVTRKPGGEFAIRVRGHEVICDVSAKEGGRDAGPTPVELLAGALGACVAVMSQRYCGTHGYKDGEVAVSLTVEMADNPKRVGGVVIDLEVPRDVPESRMEAIRRVADLCPVHATLRNPPRVDFDIVLSDN